MNRWNNPMTYRNLYDRMQKIGRIAGVKELKPHRMRHTYSTNFLNSGGGIEQLQRQLAHEHLSTTQIYGKSLEKAIRPAIERLQKYHDRLWTIIVYKVKRRFYYKPVLLRHLQSIWIFYFFGWHKNANVAPKKRAAAIPKNRDNTDSKKFSRTC